VSPSSLNPQPTRHYPILLIFALIVAYFLAAFVSYALSDYLEWRSARRDLSRERTRRDLKEERTRIQKQQGSQTNFQSNMQNILKRQGATAEEATEHEAKLLSLNDALEKGYREKLAVLDEYERELAEMSAVPFGFAGPIINLRFAFEFILPPIVGAFAIAVLLIKAL
jgi:septal ring factor EnvC (AmiA/AmiB activator)